MAKSDHEVVVDRCKVLGGRETRTTYRGTSVEFSLGGGDPQQARLGAGYGVGDRIEWRGRPGKSGFEPKVAIVRLQSRDPSGKIVSALAIVRVDGQRSCNAAFIDASAGNALARREADRIGAEFECGRDKPRIIGAETGVLQEFLHRSR